MAARKSKVYEGTMKLNVPAEQIGCAQKEGAAPLTTGSLEPTPDQKVFAMFQL
jgi:hypothetical protein